MYLYVYLKLSYNNNGNRLKHDVSSKLALLMQNSSQLTTELMWSSGNSQRCYVIFKDYIKSHNHNHIHYVEHICGDCVPAKIIRSYIFYNKY